MFNKLSLYVGSGLFLISTAFATPVTVFGPQKISPPLHGLLIRNDSISLAKNTTGVLSIKNGSGSDLTRLICTGNLAAKIKCALLNVERTLLAKFERPKYLEIKLNNQIILSKAQYSRRQGSYNFAVNLLKQNTLSTTIKGIPCSSVTLELKADVAPPHVNQPPIAEISVTPTQGFAPVTVSASAVGSSDPDGTITDYSWNFGDGFLASGMLATHVYSTAGNYTVTLTVTDNEGAKSLKTQNVVIIQNQPPTAVLKVTSATTGVVPFMASFDASGSSDPENQTLKYDWLFGDGVSSQNAGNQITHQYMTEGTYTVTLTVTDSLGASSQAQAQITATKPLLPPDPKDSAPKLSQNEQVSFYNSVSFLLSGANPIQKNVDVSQLDVNRVSVLRGKVLDDSGLPLGGAKVKVLNHPEFGETLSRLDGQFDLIVNGGGFLTLVYDLSGYLSSSRQVEVSFKDYFFAPDVVLAKLDSKVTTVNLGAAIMQAVQSTVSSDFSGDRAPTVLIPSGATANLILSDGTTKPISSLSLRITEYTKGENGPKKMPADLPTGVAYTHAVELSADEAIAQNAKHIQFSKPVSYYVDNFLNIPVGYGVPLGSLNPDTKLWEAEHDGVVLKILNIQNNLATLDVKGQGQPATVAELQAFNITQEELSQLASLYPPGKSLWRVQVNHFSAIDTNFLQGEFNPIVASLGDAYSYGKPKVGGCTDCGSIIDVHRLSLKEKIKTPVLPFDLWYSSDNAAPKADDFILRIPLSGSIIESDLISIEYEIEIAGKKIIGVAPAQPNQLFVYTWDGKDAYGRDYPYQTTAKVFVRHKLKRYYAIPAAPNDKSWGYLAANVIVTFNEERDGTYIERFSSVKLGVNRSGELFGINGWMPSILHSFNPITKTVYFGNGESKEVDETLRTLVSVGGNGLTTGVLDGALAANHPIGYPLSVAPAVDGSIYYVESQTAKIMKIGVDGYLSTVAGKGRGQDSGDGGLAINAGFSSISKIAVAPDGSIFVVDSDLRKIRKIGPDGMISTVAGLGPFGNVIVQDNVPAIQASFGVITGLVASKDGSLYISDASTNVVYKIGTDGILHRFAGNGVQGYSGDEGPAPLATFFRPIVCDIGPNDEVYISDYYNSLIRVVDKAGTIHASVGVYHSDGTISPDGTAATQSKISSSTELKVAKNGNIYFLDTGSTLRRVNSQGLIETISNRGNNPIKEPGVFNAFVSNSIFLAKDGSLIIADTSNYRIRRLGQVFIGSNPELVQIPSEDGREIYHFSSTGKHLKTLFAKTGKSKWEFSYNTSGLLISVMDSDGHQVTIQRDSSGKVASIANKYGQNILTGINGDGWLTSFQSPSGDSYQFQYSQPGLLASFTNPNGNTSAFTFDSRNNLVTDQDALGGSKTLARGDLTDGYANTITYPDGTKRTATSRINLGVQKISEITERDGTKMSWLQDLSASIENVTTNFPSGGFIMQTLSPDPRLGGAAVVNSSTAYYGVDGKNNRESKNIFLDRYDPSNIFNFRQREVYTPDYFQQPTKTYTYDSATQSWSLVSSTGRSSSGKIDSQERPTLIQKGTLEPIQISYDTFGHVSQIRQGDRISNLTYDSNGFLSSVLDPLSRQHKYTNDLVGRITQQTAPSGDNIDFLYDKNSNLLGIHPFGKDWHQFVYSLVDLFSVYQAPVVGSENSIRSYVYNLSRDLQKITRADGQEIVFGYDAAKARVTSMSMGNQQFNFAYQDIAGHLTTAINQENGANTVLQYTADRPDKWSEYGLHLPNGVTIQSYLSFARDNLGRVSNISLFTLSSPQVVIPYTYDVDSLMLSAGDLQIGRSSDNGFVSGTQLGSVSDTYSYNNFGEVIGYSSGAYSYTLQRDVLGRISQKVETTAEGASTYNYFYDSNDRLSRVDKNGVTISQYGFDGNGNRTSVTSSGQTVAAVFDKQDRIQQQGSTQYLFNSEGELQQKTQGSNITKYNYGLYGQLRSVQLPSGQNISYDINGLGLRIGKRIDGVFKTYYQWQSPTQISAEVGPTGAVISRFIYGTQGSSPDYMIKNGINYRFIKDHLGSVRFVVSAADGSLAQRLDYDEWGNVVQDTSPGFQPFGYAGGLYDSDTKLVRFGARDYDPEVGRWTSKDPIQFNGGDTNLFGYVAQDPINFIDPSGLRSPGQVRACLDGICSGTLSDQFASQTQISPSQAAQGAVNAALMIGGIVVSPAVPSATLAAVNACLSNPALCAELMTTTAGAVGSGLTGDSLPPGSSSNPWISGIDLFGGTALGLVKDNVCK